MKLVACYQPFNYSTVVAVFDDLSGCSIFEYRDFRVYDQQGDDIFGGAVSPSEFRDWLLEAGYMYIGELP